MGSPRSVVASVDTRNRGLQHHSLRQTNQRAVLNIIGFNPGVSNAEIARMSGLAPQTVSAILTDVEEDGLIVRGPVLRGRRGQPATPIYLSQSGGYAIGVEIGWGRIEVVLTNFWAQVIGRRTYHHEFPDARTVAGTIAGAVAELRSELTERQRGRLLDLGVTLPSRMGKLLSVSGAPREQVDLWADFDIAKALHEATGLETAVVNDGNAACWSEMVAHPQPKPSSFIYIYVSTFLAAGLVGDGRLWDGPSQNSVDIGSMLVCTEQGQRVAHRVASVMALANRLFQAGEMSSLDRIDEWNWDKIEPHVEAWLNDSAKALASVIFNANTVLDARHVVVDSILPRRITERLVQKLPEELAALQVVAHVPPEVTIGHVGSSAPSVGVSELALFRRYFSRSALEA